MNNLITQFHLYDNWFLENITTKPSPFLTNFADYMDSHTNCGKTYEIGLNSAVVNGMTPPGPANSNSPTSCTITLSTDSLKEARVFLVTVTAANIKAPGVSFYIYNGESTTGSSRPLVGIYMPWLEWSAGGGDLALFQAPGRYLYALA